MRGLRRTVSLNQTTAGEPTKARPSRVHTESTVRAAGAMSEVQAADEARDRVRAVLDRTGDRGGGEIEAEQHADDHVRHLQPVLAEQDEDDDPEQQYTGDRENHGRSLCCRLEPPDRTRAHPRPGPGRAEPSPTQLKMVGTFNRIRPTALTS